jgi:hypothetical protein
MVLSVEGRVACSTGARLNPYVCGFLHIQACQVPEHVTCRVVVVPWSPWPCQRDSLRVGDSRPSTIIQESEHNVKQYTCGTVNKYNLKLQSLRDLSPWE